MKVRHSFGSPTCIAATWAYIIFQVMRYTKKEQQINKHLLVEVEKFLEATTALQCIDSISFLLLNQDENGERLLNMDTEPLRPLMRLLSNLTRIQFTIMEDEA